MAKRHYPIRFHDIGRRLIALRNHTGLTQIELAALIGVSRRSMLKWEGGEGVPNGTHLHQLFEVFVKRKAFTASQEVIEAQALWEDVSEAATKRLGEFNTAWFAQLLAQQGMEDGGGSRAPIADAPAAIIDWGEAIDVSTLYGREAELAQLRQWVLDDRCRMVALVGLGGIGKTSLALTFGQHMLAHFDVVLFRSLHNGPSLAELLDQIARVVSKEQIAPPEQVSDKIAQLIQLLRERHCLLILDNFEAILQPGTLTGTYRTGYADYGALLRALSERKHQSCLIVTSREKPAELGAFEGRAGPVRTLALAGLDASACQIMLEAKEMVGTALDLHALARLYSGNPLALTLVTEPIRELFDGDVGAFLAAGDAFFNGVGALLQAQFARSMPLEHVILGWLAVERERVPLNALLADIGDGVPQREVLAALESLRHRMLIERAPDRAAFTLQPVILEYMTEQLVAGVQQEIVAGQPQLLNRHALVQATAKEYVRHSQEHLIGTPLLERLVATYGSAGAVEQTLLTLFAVWRGQPPVQQGYGPGNVVNLLRLLRGHLRGLDLKGLAIRQAKLQGVDVQDTSLVDVVMQDTLVTETFDAVTAVAISSTGEVWAAATTRGEVLIWAAGGVTLLRSWQAHTDMVWTLSFSPDGRTLASGSWDGGVKLWDVAGGTLLWWRRHTGHVNRVAFAPDGGTLASSGNDATIRLWEAQTGMERDTLAHPDPIPVIAWSPDGRLLASGDVQGDIRVWSVQPHQPPTCAQVLQGHSTWVDGLDFAPDGQTLASASWDGLIRLWDVASGGLHQTFAGHTDQVSRVVWSSDGVTLASSSRDQTIRLWHVTDGNCRAVLRGHTAGAKGLAFTPDGGSLLSGGGDGTLRVWNVASGACMRMLQGYATALDDVDWSPDGMELVSGGTDGLVTVYTIGGATAPRVLSGHGGLVIAVGWSPDGQWLASSEWDNVIRLWNARSGACLEILRHPDDPGNSFYGLAWSPDGQRLAGGTERHGVFVWDVRAHAEPWTVRVFSTWIRYVAWSPDGAQLAGGGDDGAVYIWDAVDGALLQRLPGHHGMVTCLAWSPDGKRLASGSSGSEGGELFVWDPQRGERVAAATEPRETVYALAWSSNEAVITSGGDGILRWWDVQRRAYVRMRAAHQGKVQSLRRSPDGTRLASCGDDGAIMLWDIRNGEHLQTIRRDRPYERMDITGLTGISDAQRASLIALGARDDLDDQHRTGDASAESLVAQPHRADTGRQTPDVHRAVMGLPFQPTSFIGRSAEVKHIVSVLSGPTCRLLTLVGPGGMGKTRLALAVAATQTAAFADGIAFVALAAVNTPSQIVFAIGDTLALSFTGQPNPTAHLLDHLRERRMLLVLDNFEHLLHGADLVVEILAHAPQVTILVTSRERLHLQAEWLFAVKGLSYPTTTSQPDDLTTPTDYSAVQLFVQRAMQAQSEVTVSETTLAMMVRICQHVAGMPLGIELAAASLRTRSLAEIEQQIRTNLDLLTTTMRDVPARHRSMRAVFDHSWHLLGDEERALFSHLAVFRGGWTAKAAVQVVGATRAALGALVDKSLIYQTSAEPFVDEPRFMMLEPIREYALERLGTRSDAMTIRQRHAHYFTALAEAAAAEWNTPHIEMAVARLRREYDNMRAALQWALDTGNGTHGLWLAQALWKFWRSSSYTSEGRTWLEQLLAVEERSTDAAATTARRRGLQAAAWLASDQHDFETATRFFEQSRTLQRASDIAEDELDLLVNAARQARVGGHYQQATQLLEDGLARHRARGAHAVIGSAESARFFDELGLVLRELGLVLREQGHFERAAALFADGVTLHRTNGDRASLAFALLGLADVARDQGDSAGVKKYAEESLTMLRELGITWAIGFAQNTLALGAYYAGDVTHARALIHESVVLFRALKAEDSLAEVLVTLGKVLRAHADGVAAYTAFREALRIALAVGPRLMVAPALEGLASIMVTQGNEKMAIRVLAGASTLREQMSTPVWPIDQAIIAQALATARAALGDSAFTEMWAEAQALPLEQMLSAIPSGVVVTTARDQTAS